MDEDGLSLLKQEMENEEIYLKVNAIHRMKIVIHDIGTERTISELIPYLNEIISKDNDDEVLFAIAEEIGQIYHYFNDKTVFLDLLFDLARQSETVVREQATESLNLIVERLSDAEIQNVYAQKVIQLAQQHEQFPARQSSCALFEKCYHSSGPHKEKLRKKFIELCNEDQPMIRRACARRLGQFAVKLDKQCILQEILPIFRQLSQDEQDLIRVLCLESLIPMAMCLSKEENQIHTLGTLLAAGEDKSWKVRLAFAKNFAAFAEAFGKEITDNNLIQTFTLLLSDNEFEVKLAAINNLPRCLPYLSNEKMCNLILPTIHNCYSDGTVQFKAGVAEALSCMAPHIGKDHVVQKILPILQQLVVEENQEILTSVVEGLHQISQVVGHDHLRPFLDVLEKQTSVAQWRVRQAIFKLLGDLGILFGIDVFRNLGIQNAFLGYLHNSAAKVRTEGIKISQKLANEFKSDWIVNHYIPAVTSTFDTDKKGYNYRICCIQSLGGVAQYLQYAQITQLIIPIFVKGLQDQVPNVRFSTSQVILDVKESIDKTVFKDQIVPNLQHHIQDQDKDVVYFAKKCLNMQQ